MLPFMRGQTVLSILLIAVSALLIVGDGMLRQARLDAAVDTPRALPAVPVVKTVLPEPPPRARILASLPFGPPRPPVFSMRAKSAGPETSGGRGARIALVIDDVGMDVAHSRMTVDMPAAVTLAFLPYAPATRRLAAQALKKGHELMIHMPMQPEDGSLDTGPIALTEGMTDAAFDAMLDKAFASFDGYIGMNNHMGSRLTQDPGAMARLMAILRQRGLLFVDSRTAPLSVAAAAAAKAGIPHAVRDVFLDDDPSRRAVEDSLRKAENVARRTGLAVVIGHPRKETIEALNAWFPGLEAKNIVLVPISAAVARPGL